MQIKAKLKGVVELVRAKSFVLITNRTALVYYDIIDFTKAENAALVMLARDSLDSFVDKIFTVRKELSKVINRERQRTRNAKTKSKTVAKRAKK